MKRLRLFSFMLLGALFFLSTSLIAQRIQMKTTTGDLFQYGSQATLTTTDSAYHTIQTIELATNTAGILEVSVTGVKTSTGDAVTGAQILRFNKKSGTLTLGTPADELAKVTDAGLGTATWDITTSSNNVIIRVKGKLSSSIRWRCLVKQIQ